METEISRSKGKQTRTASGQSDRAIRVAIIDKALNEATLYSRPNENRTRFLVRDSLLSSMDGHKRVVLSSSNDWRRWDKTRTGKAATKKHSALQMWLQAADNLMVEKELNQYLSRGSFPLTSHTRANDSI
jgi:hypothetical protein